MKESFKLGAYLMLVAAIAGLALASVNRVTEPRIRAHREEAEIAALAEVLPAAATFDRRDSEVVGFDAAGETVGVILKVRAPGYSSVIEALVGLDAEYRVMGVKVLFQNETPGLGVKIAAPAFTCRFQGLEADAIRLKKDGGAIDAITAATVSSRALTDGIREAIDEYRQDHR